MTPVIDIVFLLIVFFVVVFQFIETENEPVALPRGCDFAENADDAQNWPATITMRRNKRDEITFIIGSEKMVIEDKPKLIEFAAETLNNLLEKLPKDERVVVLRIDKNIDYGHAQYALSAVAKSIAMGLQLATTATQNEDAARTASF
jgi:biopolymer transport protein ExbD